MSKNFELLLQAGAVGHYFHDVEVQPQDKQPPATETRYRVPRNEEFDQLVRRLFLNSQQSNVRSLMISGASGTTHPADACSQIGKSLASMVDASVCIVDANIALPSLHRRFADDNLVGLSDALFQSKSARSFARQVENSNLYFLPTGTAAPNSRTMEADFTALLDGLKQEFDYLVVLAPAADSGRNLTAIGRACDGVLLALESGGVPLNVMLRIKRQLDGANIPLFGVVLNGAADARNQHSSIVSPLR